MKRISVPGEYQSYNKQRRILFIDKLGPIGRLAARQNLARLEAEYRDAQSMGEIPPDSELIQRLEALADGGSTPS